MTSNVSDPTVYNVHDNGGRPFCVKMFASGLVEVWKNVYDEENDIYIPTTLVVSYPHPKVWIGYTGDAHTTRLNGGDDSVFDGNSFLLQPNVDVLEYVYMVK